MENMFLRVTNEDDNKFYLNFSNVSRFEAHEKGTEITHSKGKVVIKETVRKLRDMLNIKRERGDYYGD